MKKSRILGFALTLAATMVVGGAMGQNPADIKGTHTPIASDAVKAGSSFITTGEKTDFYVLPDLAFHVSYDPANNTGIIPGTTWTWTVPAGLTKTGTPTGNYVELTAGAVGVYSVKTQENAPGGCVDATGTSFLVHVFPAPTFTFGTGIDFASATCAGGDKPVSISLTASDYVAAKWSLNVYEGTIKADGTDFVLGDEIVAEAKSFDYTKVGGSQTLNGKAWVATAGTAYSAGAAAGDTPANGTFTLAGTYPINHKGTKPVAIYRFSVKADGAEGVSDFITRKTTAAKYYASASYVDFVVKKAPTTGPVYHIANNVAQ